ncbi:MAG: hypothetical protein ACK2UI_11310, partial [Anaerolineae bacterium]
LASADTPFSSGRGRYLKGIGSKDTAYCDIKGLKFEVNFSPLPVNNVTLRQPSHKGNDRPFSCKSLA